MNIAGFRRDILHAEGALCNAAHPAADSGVEILAAGVCRQFAGKRAVFDIAYNAGIVGAAVAAVIELGFKRCAVLCPGGIYLVENAVPKLCGTVASGGDDLVVVIAIPCAADKIGRISAVINVLFVRRRAGLARRLQRCAVAVVFAVEVHPAARRAVGAVDNAFEHIRHYRAGGFLVLLFERKIAVVEKDIALVVQNVFVGMCFDTISLVCKRCICLRMLAHGDTVCHTAERKRRIVDIRNNAPVRKRFGGDKCRIPALDKVIVNIAQPEQLAGAHRNGIERKLYRNIEGHQPA